jgi:myo-inositol-1-phosphate synthase
MKNKIRVAIIGVGNCASAFVQGLAHYSQTNNNTDGLMMPVIGGYSVADIEVAAAFDVTAEKVGRPLSLAITGEPNNTLQFANYRDIVNYRNTAAEDVIVQRGPTFDGLGEYLSNMVDESHLSPVNVSNALRESDTEIVINYLPVGSEKAARYYASAAMMAGCAFVNCMPTFIASDRHWADEFASNRLPLLGDDVKSQLGATSVHRALSALFRDRGVRLDRTSQLNVGGNADFYNMLERKRLDTKKKSKTAAVRATFSRDLPANSVHIGPSDYVPWLQDRKWAHIRLEGSGFGGAPINIELKLEVVDSPNSAGVVVDAVRCARVALDRGESGAIAEPSAWLFKHPPVQAPDEVWALDGMEVWLIGAPADVQGEHERGGGQLAAGKV